jgi:hypothetical protein
MCYSLIQSRKLLSRLCLHPAVRIRVDSSSVVSQSALKLFVRTVYVCLRTSVHTIPERLRCLCSMKEMVARVRTPRPGLEDPHSYRTFLSVFFVFFLTQLLQNEKWHKCTCVCLSVCNNWRTSNVYRDEMCFKQEM